MLRCWNATRPPMMTARNSPTIRKRRSTARETRRSIRSGISTRGSGAGRRPVDEQTALGDDLLAGLQVGTDLDIVAIGETGLDIAKLQRLVVIGHPKPDTLALVDQRLLLHAHRLVVAAGIDGDAGKHLRLEQPVLVVDGRPDH